MAVRKLRRDFTPHMTNDEENSDAVQGGNPSLEGYFYQVDVSIWTALDLVVAKKLAQSLILEWLYEQDGMTRESPAYEVKVRVKKNKKLRDKGFTKPEAETILKARLVTPSAKMSVEMAAARR